MKKYIAHLVATKTPHERRRVAFAVASTVTAVVFVAWVISFGAGMTNTTTTASQADQFGASSVAAVAQSLSAVPGLEIGQESVIGR